MGNTRRALLGVGAAAVAGGAIYGGSQVFGAGADLAPGRSRAKPMRTDRTPPSEADVVVIGGGNLGAAAAYYLARAGHRVVLCEKGAIGGEASGRSVGQVFSLGASATVLPIIDLAKRMWVDINAELQQETGYRRNGLIMKIADAEQRHYWEGWKRDRGDLANSAVLLDAPATRARVQAASPWSGAIFDPTDGCAEPTLVATAFATAAQKLGATIVAPCAVRGFETSASGVSSVITEAGVIRTRNVVCAGGAWSSAFFHNFGVRLPTADVFSWCASFYDAHGPDGAGDFDNVTWRKQIDGGYTTSMQVSTAPITPRLLREMGAFGDTAGDTSWTVKPRLGRYFFDELLAGDRWTLDQVTPFEKRRILEPALNRGVVEGALKKMRQEIPAFGALRLGEAWGGVLSATPDQLPVLGAVTKIPGLIVATGFTDGLTLAPAVGKAVADLVSGRPTDFDLKPFSIERFEG